MKKFDFKPFLMEKGERVGLFAAAALSLLLVGLGVFKGLSAGSSTANAKKLEGLVKAMEDKQRGARPTAADEPGLVSLDAFGFREVNPADYPGRVLFHGPRFKDTKRQTPEILAPEEYAVELVRVQLPALDFQWRDVGGRRVPTHVTMIEGAPAGAMGAMGAAGALGAAGGPRPGAPNLGGLLNRGGAGAVGALGGGAVGAGVRGGRPGFGNLGGGANIPRTRDKDGKPTKQVPIEDAEKQSGFSLATRALPRRMGIVAMSFPYKKQVEEFRQKLRLDTHGAVLTERVKGEKKDETWNSFQFRNILVQRAVVEINKPIKEEDWDTVPIEESYKALLINVQKQVEDHPERLKEVAKVGRVMKMPKPFAHFHYPDVSRRLKTLEATLEKLGEDPQKKGVIPPSNLIRGDFDPYDPGAAQQGAGGGDTTPMQPPMGGGGGDNPYFIPGSGAQREVKETPIEHCLLRFLDVTDLEPGKTYSYRFKIKMANPNYSPRPEERKDTYPSDAKDKELESQWFYVNKHLVVPSDTFTYALDINPRALPPLGQNDTVFQFQRWVESYTTGKDTDNPTHTGEWVMAPREVIRRGEYVKAVSQCEVPIKNLNQHFFTIRKEWLAFGEEKTWPDGTRVYSVLVDFEGGKTPTYQHLEPPRKEGGQPQLLNLQDDIATEVLILSPDGRVTAHNTALDSQDRARVIRANEYVDRLKQVKKEASGGGTGPFGG